MGLFRLAIGLALLAVPAGGSALAQTPATAARPIVVEVPGQTPITVAVWSPPAAAVNGADGTGSGGSARSLIVMSHGTGATPFAHFDTAQALAEAGFVVAAPMHPGDNYQDDSAVGTPDWLAGRSRHLARVIDFMIGEWAGRQQLRPDRVGVFGFSAGATTALIAIGGVPDLDRAAASCASRPEFVCQLMRSHAGATSAPALAHDRRIGAAVIAAPGLGFAFEPSGLATVTVPVQLWVGSDDEIVPYETNAGVVRRLLRGPLDFHSVDGAVHLSFLAPCGPESPPQICRDNEGFDRTAFHQDFNRSVVEFFHARLRSIP